jgi:hypothetical protein
MALKENNDKFYGYTPKMKKPSGKEGTIYSGAEEGNTHEHLGNELDRVNPYEFRKGMDYELTAVGCMRLAESTPEERQKATEKVIKNLQEHGGYYTALITYETNFRGQDGAPSFKSWLKEQEEEYGMKEVDQKYKNDKMTEPKKSKEEYTKKFETSPSPLKERKMKSLKKAIQKEVSKILKEQSAKQAAMADMEDAGEVEGGKKNKGKGKGKAKKDKPVRKDRFDKEEEAIKDILFRVDANGKKPKEEGDYTQKEPAPGSMLAIKDEMLDKYKEMKAEEEDPKKTLEEYNKLLSEKNEEFKEAIESFVEEFEGNGVTIADMYGEKLSDTIKNLQQRLKDGLSKARAGIEEEERGIRRQVAETQMTREEALRLLEICKENGISLREGTESVRVYYEIAKAAYLEGVANALHL